MNEDDEKRLLHLEEKFRSHESGETGDIRLSPKALTMFLALALGGNGAMTYFSTRPDSVRPDPFTGEQGRELEKKIDENKERVSEILRDLKLIERRLDACERKT